MHKLLLFLVFFLFPAAVSAETFERTVKANSRTVIGGFASYEVETCYPVQIPAVTVGQPPSNGSIEIKVEQWAIGKDSRCVGKQVRGPIYIYTPKKGYKGTDELTINVPWSGSDLGRETISSFTFRIRVE